MDRENYRVALVQDVFFGEGADEALRKRLREAKAAGAELAVLPELPCQRWAPATRRVRDEDAEGLRGPRFRLQQEAAREVGIALVGGAIVQDEKTGRRHNTALTFDAHGELISTYQKLHVPEEEGFWETSHYEPGDLPPKVVGAFSQPFGVQLCSDVNRPQGCQILSAQGAAFIAIPRATPLDTYSRWRYVFQANAVTTATYILSVNRPRAEDGAGLQGPAVAVAPDGEVLVETMDPVSVVDIDVERLVNARRAYPGYLPVRAELYAQAWAELARRQLRH